MQNIDILRTAYFSNPATGTSHVGVPPHCRYKHPLAGTPLSALVHSEEISTASSGVSLLCKTLTFRGVPIFASPLLDHHISGSPPTAGTNTHCRYTSCGSGAL